MIQARSLHTTLIIAVLALTGTMAAAPAPTPESVIDARHAGFKKMGGAMKAMKEQLQTDAPSKPILAASAQIIAATAPGQAKLFPAGTGPASGIKTDALANIWTDRANFDAQMAKLAVESGKLVTVVASGDMTAINAQYKATGATCGGCHRVFRADT